MSMILVFRESSLKYPALFALSLLLVTLFSGTALAFITSDEPLDAAFPVFGERRDFDSRWESYIWLDSLSRVMADLERDHALDRYFQGSNPIYSCCVAADGYIYVSFEYDDVSEATVSEIYAVIDKYARRWGIENVPAAFYKGNIRGYELEFPPPPHVAEYHPPASSFFDRIICPLLSVFCGGPVRLFRIAPA